MTRASHLHAGQSIQMFTACVWCHFFHELQVSSIKWSV